MVNYFHSVVLAPFFSTAELSVNICSSLNGNSNGQAPSPGSIALGNVYRELYLRDLGYFILRGLPINFGTLIFHSLADWADVFHHSTNNN